jgi:DHA3 family macrolide efflux protein-like MFS transporter
MLIGGILLGLLLGLLSGGRIQNLAVIHLRWTWLLLAALILRFATEAGLNAQIAPIEMLRLPLLAGAFGLLLAALWVNRGYPGLSLAFLGILSNAIVIIANGGYMPIWDVSLAAAGMTPEDVNRAFHQVVSVDTADFLGRALILGDVIPLPIPIEPLRNVSSLGDVFLSLGLAFFLFAGVVRVPTKEEESADAALRARLAATGGTGLTPALQGQATLQRPLVLGADRPRLAGPGAAAVTARTARTAQTGPPIAIPLPHLPADVLARVRRHPYVRLALNGSFSALWSGQLVSLFGDRVHQMALAATVYTFTGSALATAFVFVAATLPNLLFSPIAGTLVDRWDHREVLVVSDILRAATVLLIPIAATVNILLVYPLVFVVTTISIFFRPARVAILPRIVREDELLTGNSALWVGETIVDVIGFPLAGLFVALLANNLAVAFWLDSATYLGSALLLSTIAARPMPAPDPRQAAADADLPTGFRAELAAGWRFLRTEPVLLANTIQATVAQLTVGVLIGLTAVFSEQVFGPQGFDWRAVYGFIEGSQGAGNLVGGFLIGLVGIRFAKGRMIIAGYTFLGLFTTLMALSGNLGVVLAIAFGIGVANMVFIIPSQTLFQERTPAHLIGRVVGFRFSLVFGAMTLSIGFGGIVAELLGVTTVLAAAGVVTMIAGLAGWFVPAVRDA